MKNFKEIIKTREEFRAIMKMPSDLVTRKTLSSLDKHCGVFINRSPFMLLATGDAKGNVDISPKGDPAGFVKILDDKTLLIPDRPGNRRADSIENILQNPKVGLIFLIPGKKETLRIGGTATVVRDADIRDSMAINGKTPEFVIAVEIQEAFFHCSKCMIRSQLWEPAQWPSLDGLPNLAETMVDAGKLELSNDEMHEIVLRDEKERLY